MSAPEVPEQITWPVAAVMIGILIVACIFVLGMNMLPLLAAGCR